MEIRVIYDANEYQSVKEELEKRERKQRFANFLVQAFGLAGIFSWEVFRSMPLLFLGILLFICGLLILPVVEKDPFDDNRWDCLDALRMLKESINDASARGSDFLIRTSSGEVLCYDGDSAYLFLSDQLEEITGHRIQVPRDFETLTLEYTGDGVIDARFE